MSYEPTFIDVMWAADMIGLIRDGGLLVFPSTQLMYQLRHPEKKLELLNVDKLEEFSDLHERTRSVFRVLGWSVVP